MEPRWQLALANMGAVLGDIALGLAPLVPVLAFGWLVWRAVERLPLLGGWSLLLPATSGAAIGIGAVLLSPVGAYLTPGAVLRAGAWWDVGGSVLAGERISLAATGLGPMLTVPVGLLPPLAGVCAAIALVAAVGSAALLGGMRLARLPPVPLLVSAIAAGACAALVGIILLCVLAWTLALLNFWTLALVTIGFQYWRHRHR